MRADMPGFAPVSRSWQNVLQDHIKCWDSICLTLVAVDTDQKGTAKIDVFLLYRKVYLKKNSDRKQVLRICSVLRLPGGSFQHTVSNRSGHLLDK
jgi:hypothetical protein